MGRAHCLHSAAPLISLDPFFFSSLISLSLLCGPSDLSPLFMRLVLMPVRGAALPLPPPSARFGRTHAAGPSHLAPGIAPARRSLQPGCAGGRGRRP